MKNLISPGVRNGPALGVFVFDLLTNIFRAGHDTNLLQRSTDKKGKSLLTQIHPRLVNQLFENPDFQVNDDSLGYIARDIINMNWWNTSGVLLGYSKNKRISAPFSETQKRIAVQLKEFYRVDKLSLRDEKKFRDELRGYIAGNGADLFQLSIWSMPTRANPSQYFHDASGNMTWIDCTSRATYAAKYVFQNGYVDFDGFCRYEDGSRIAEAIKSGRCFDLGVSHLFVDGKSEVKAEIFSQKYEQLTILEWVEKLGVKVLPERQWLLEKVGHVRTDPAKKYEAEIVAKGGVRGLNERLYGFATSHSYEIGAAKSSAVSDASHASSASRASNASDASRASNASDASRASHASSASHASRASNASSASDASRASHASSASHARRASNASSASSASNASHASRASSASDAGCTGFTGKTWESCPTAISKPNGLFYPPEFRANIFAMAGHWKINPDIVRLAKKGYFDPFSGHGKTPLYCKRMGIRYLGFDTNKRAFENFLNIVADECQNAPGAKVEIRCADSTLFCPELVDQFDLCYTSPPYFNFEEYGGNTAHYEGCKTYQDFHNKITIPVFSNVYKYLVQGGTLALQTEKDKSARQLWQSVIESLGFIHVEATLTGGEAVKYSAQAKRDQTLLIFQKPGARPIDDDRQLGLFGM